jgi:phage terminase large subunit-like protein
MADPRTKGEQVIAFAACHLVVPTGPKRGEPMILEDFQCAFILAIFDNPHDTKEAIFSIAARNGKTFLVAVILLAYLIGPLAEPNINVASGALSREQAALCFNLMHKILLESPDCKGLWDSVPSSKKIVGLTNNAEYVALSADAKTGYGRDLKVILLDESGQIVGPRSDFTDMLESRQGSHDDALFITCSTQGRSDADYLSLAIDNAQRTQDKQTVCHVYTADRIGADGKKVFVDLTDEKAWRQANPAVGIFRSLSDLEKQLSKADEIPAKEPAARNQYLNQRIAMEQLAISPSVWKGCEGTIDLEVFRGNRVSMGLDLSARNDLTAAVLCAEDDDGVVHTLPFVFCPTSGIEERARRDRAPYDLWVRDEDMLPIGGKTMDFDQIADSLNSELANLNIVVAEIHYDKAMITHFQSACERVGVFQECEWIGVPQFFKDMGMRLASLTGIMAEGKLRHGGHPVLAMSASVAVAKVGREGVTSLAKNLSTQRIDPLVALVMAAWPFGDGREHVAETDVSAWVA